VVTLDRAFAVLLGHSIGTACNDTEFQSGFHGLVKAFDSSCSVCLSALSVSVCVSLSLSNILYSYTSKDFSTIITCDTTEVSLFARSSSRDYKTPYLVSVRLSACPQL